MKPNMHDNFKLLEKRVLDSLEKTDLERIKYYLERIKTPTITTGVGGSSVVSNYAAKVLEKKKSKVEEEKIKKEKTKSSDDAVANDTVIKDKKSIFDIFLKFIIFRCFKYIISYFFH